LPSLVLTQLHAFVSPFIVLHLPFNLHLPRAVLAGAMKDHLVGDHVMCNFLLQHLNQHNKLSYTRVFGLPVNVPCTNLNIVLEAVMRSLSQKRQDSAHSEAQSGPQSNRFQQQPRVSINALDDEKHAREMVPEVPPGSQLSERDVNRAAGYFVGAFRMGRLGRICLDEVPDN